MNGKHVLIMLLCCLIPLAAIFLVSVFGISLDNLGTLALVLLCPLLHLLLMRGMVGHNHGAQGQPACHRSGTDVPRALPAREVAESDRS